MKIFSIIHCSHHFRNSQIVNSIGGNDFAKLFTLWSSLPATTQHVGNAGGLQTVRCQGFEVRYYDFTLDALALMPSDVSNDGVYLGNSGK